MRVQDLITLNLRHLHPSKDLIIFYHCSVFQSLICYKPPGLSIRSVYESYYASYTVLIECRRERPYYSNGNRSVRYWTDPESGASVVFIVRLVLFPTRRLSPSLHGLV